MTVNVKGVLKTPLNIPVANVPIKVVTTNGFGDVLTTAEAIYFTDEQGQYDFDLAYATHEIYVMFTDTYELQGVSVTNEAVPTPSTISELLRFTTPIQPPIVDDIYNDLTGCIDDLENAFDTCTTQLSQQVADGDTGVCQAMTTYTNDRLQACSAELTTAIQAGDAQVLLEAQSYADDKGNEISCCTTALQTQLAVVCATMTSCTGANGTAIAQTREDLAAGDAQVLNQATAYSDTINGTTCADLITMVRACDAAVYTCMFAISTDVGNIENDLNILEVDLTDLCEDVQLQTSGYQIVTTAGAATASIALLAQSLSDASVACSKILMQADKIVMHNGNPDSQQCPFYIENNTVYMDNAFIKDLTGDKIRSNTTIRAGSGSFTAGMNGDDSGNCFTNRNHLYRFWAGAEYARDASGQPVANFLVDRDGTMTASNASVAGHLTAQSGGIKGTFLVGGTGVTTSDALILHGANAPTSNGTAMSIRKNGVDRTYLTYGGQFVVKDQLGNVKMNLDPINDIYEFKGQIGACQIVGDVAAGAHMSFSEKSTTVTSYKNVDLLCICVSEAFSEARTVSVLRDVYMTLDSGTEEGWINGETYVCNPNGSLQTRYINVVNHMPDGAKSPAIPAGTSLCVPANCTGVFKIGFNIGGTSNGGNLYFNLREDHASAGYSYDLPIMIYQSGTTISVS